MLRFVDFCKSHNILDPIAYIDKMVELKISPSLWDRQEAYKFYLEKLDKQVDPYILAEKTLSIILELSNALEINPCDLFDRLPLGEIVELIEKHFLRKEDFLNHQQVKIQFLIDNNIISADEQKLQFVDKKQIDIFREFYWYGEVNYYNSDSTEKLILDALYEKGMISFGQTLFSKSESNYLNFIMNNSKFDNSWGIRNKYQHGSPAYDSEEQYYFDSSISLLILIIYASKINEEIIYKKHN